MALGTLFGSWRIVKIMGSRLFAPFADRGISAEWRLLLPSACNVASVPISTTYAIAGGILELGNAKAGPQDDGYGHSTSFALGSLRSWLRHWLARSAIG